MGLAGYQDDKGSMQFETGFDVGETVTYLGASYVVHQIYTGATKQDPIKLLLTVDGEQRQVDSRLVTKG